MAAVLIQQPLKGPKNSRISSYLVVDEVDDSMLEHLRRLC